MLGSILSSLIFRRGARESAGSAAEAAPTSPVSAPSELEQLDRAGCLIRVDYPYRPRRRPWDESTALYRLIAAGSERYLQLLREFATFTPFFERIAVSGEAPNDFAPRWVNGWVPALDAISLYGLVALHNPRWYVEIGSGNSTMFVRRSIDDHRLRTQIVSIDPYPRADIDRICDRIIRAPCEDVETAFFDTLSADDILFVDNSHRAFQSSDVTVFFTEILPRLPSGMIYGVHDIFLPWDYPQEWTHRFYNEQYLLACYLLGGARGDQILAPNLFLTSADAGLLAPLAPVFDSPKLQGIQKSGAAFWLRRG